MFLLYFCCLPLQILQVFPLAAVVNLVVYVFQGKEAVFIVASPEWAIFLSFDQSLLVFEKIACFKQITETVATHLLHSFLLLFFVCFGKTANGDAFNILLTIVGRCR